MRTSGIDTTIVSKASVDAPGAAVWQVVGAAAAGTSHLRTGLPCQDAQGFLTLPNGLLLVALADGAGSAEFSDQGARRAVEEALRALAGGLEEAPLAPADWPDVLRQAFALARKAVLGLANGDSTRAYACTLTCAVASAQALAVGQIGDGAVVALDAEDALFTVTRLQRGEYANETHFLTQEDALDQLIVDLVERPLRGLAVMSDGLIRLALKLPSLEPHLPFFQPLFRFARASEPQAAEQLAAFLESERVNARTDDDKSLVLAVLSRAASENSRMENAPSSQEDGDR
jgi:hypothetical protein